jgi:hypothetical protein
MNTGFKKYFVVDNRVGVVLARAVKPIVRIGLSAEVIRTALI